MRPYGRSWALRTPDEGKGEGAPAPAPKEGAPSNDVEELRAEVRALTAKLASKEDERAKAKKGEIPSASESTVASLTEEIRALRSELAASKGQLAAAGGKTIGESLLGW